VDVVRAASCSGRDGASGRHFLASTSNVLWLRLIQLFATNRSDVGRDNGTDEVKDVVLLPAQSVSHACDLEGGIPGQPGSEHSVTPLADVT
jgi:hypothetical protein